MVVAGCGVARGVHRGVHGGCNSQIPGVHIWVRGGCARRGGFPGGGGEISGGSVAPAH